MRILINASTSIGDSLYCSFLLDNVMRWYPDASLQVLCWHPMLSYYQAYPIIEQVIPYDFVARDHLFVDFLCSPPVDLYVDMQHTSESARLGCAIKAKERIGIYALPEMKSLYTYVIPFQKGKHYYEGILEGIQLFWSDKDVRGDIRVPLTEQKILRAESLLLEHNITPDSPYVLIHPGAKGTKKLWQIDYWCDVIHELSMQGYKVVLVGSQLKSWGGESISDEVLCSELYERMKKECISFCGKTSDLLILGALMKKASLYVGLDTGPTHLAALTGTPVIQIYRYTTEETYCLWHLQGQHTRTLSADDLETILPEIVLAAADELITNRAHSTVTYDF